MLLPGDVVIASRNLAGLRDRPIFRNHSTNEPAFTCPISRDDVLFVLCSPMVSNDGYNPGPLWRWLYLLHAPTGRLGWHQFQLDHPSNFFKLVSR